MRWMSITLSEQTELSCAFLKHSRVGASFKRTIFTWRVVNAGPQAGKRIHNARDNGPLIERRQITARGNAVQSRTRYQAMPLLGDRRRQALIVGTP